MTLDRPTEPGLELIGEPGREPAVRRGRTAEWILVVEDDPDARSLVVEHLGLEGWATLAAGSGHEAIELMDGHDVGLVVLDLGLPDAGGLDVLTELRRRDPGVPVIILTAQRGEPARVRGLWSGADDYLEKPFSPRELVARVRSVLRRGGISVSERIARGELVVDRAQRSVVVGGREVHLTRLEFDLLAELASRPGQVFSRQQLADRVWARLDLIGDLASVTELVRRTRHKLQVAGAVEARIETVRGVGYRFVVAPG